MTVAELIGKLSELPTDLIVAVPGTGMQEGALVPLECVRQLKVSAPARDECRKPYFANQWIYDELLTIVALAPTDFEL